MRFPLPTWNELNRATDGHGLETNLTEAVIGSAFEVSKALGAGFLETVYEQGSIPSGTGRYFLKAAKRYRRHLAEIVAMLAARNSERCILRVAYA